MMYKLIFSAAIVSSVYAANSALSGLPSCAVDCLGDNLSSTGCSGVDIACICSSDSFISGLIPCVTSSCSSDELQQVVSFAEKLCSGAGVSLDVGGLSQSSTSKESAAATSAATSEAAVVTSEAAATSAVAAATSAAATSEAATTSCEPAEATTVANEETTGGVEQSNGAGRNIGYCVAAVAIPAFGLVF